MAPGVHGFTCSSCTAPGYSQSRAQKMRDRANHLLQALVTFMVSPSSSHNPREIRRWIPKCSGDGHTDSWDSSGNKLENCSSCMDARKFECRRRRPPTLTILSIPRTVRSSASSSSAPSSHPNTSHSQANLAKQPLHLRMTYRLPSLLLLQKHENHPGSMV